MRVWSPGTPRSSLVTPAIQAVFGNFYLGVAQGALATAREYTRSTSRPWLLSGVDAATTDPYVLATYGRLVASARAVEALADRVGEHLERADAAGGALTWDAASAPTPCTTRWPTSAARSATTTSTAPTRSSPSTPERRNRTVTIPRPLATGHGFPLPDGVEPPHRVGYAG